MEKSPGQNKEKSTNNNKSFRVEGNSKKENEEKKGKKKQPTKSQTKKMFFYLSKDFPLQFQTLIPLLSFLSNGNVVLQNLSKVLEQEKFKSYINQNGFPVKI